MSKCLNHANVWICIEIPKLSNYLNVIQFLFNIKFLSNRFKPPDYFYKKILIISIKSLRHFRVSTNSEDEKISSKANGFLVLSIVDRNGEPNQKGQSSDTIFLS